jgi:hypothetical protein
MVNLRETWGKGKSLEWLADAAANRDEDSDVGWALRSEFLYRQTEAQVRQAEAAERTAEASITSAKQMVRYTRYMFWTMVFIAVSTVATVALAWRH